nr:glycoside hydrolase family 92 protein [Deltaproteobacteria bacterium]
MEARRNPPPDTYYWHGNEPEIHAPWIPSAFDDSPAASPYVDWVRSTRLLIGPDGIPGNDDAGTMSAWYPFSRPSGVFPSRAPPIASAAGLGDRGGGDARRRSDASG